MFELVELLDALCALDHTKLKYNETNASIRTNKSMVKQLDKITADGVVLALST